MSEKNKLIVLFIFFFLYFVFVILLLIPGVYSITKSQYCSAWSNLSYDDCDYLWDKFNVPLSTNSSSNVSITIKEVSSNIVEKEVTDERIISVVRPMLDSLVLSYESRFNNYTKDKDNEMIAYLKDEIKVYKDGMNMSFVLDSSDVLDELYLKKTDFESYKNDVNNRLVSSSSSSKSNDSDLVMFGVIGVVVVGGFMFMKSKNDEKKQKEILSAMNKEEQMMMQSQNLNYQQPQYVPREPSRIPSPRPEEHPGFKFSQGKGNDNVNGGTQR